MPYEVDPDQYTHLDDVFIKTRLWEDLKGAASRDSRSLGHIHNLAIEKYLKGRLLARQAGEVEE